MQTVRTEPPLGELGYLNEVKRKLLHLFALTIPIGYYWVPRWTAAGIIFVFFLGSLVIDLGRFRHWRVQRLWTWWVNPIVRPRESVNFTGATHILLSGWLCPLLFSRPAAACGMIIIILGDVAAALIGRRWGRHRYAGNRSFEGSLGFLAGGVIAGVATPGVPTAIGLAAALLATIVEAFSRHIDDNLTVPLLTGLFVHLALRGLQ
ncbi:MAG: hypothetical protein HY304_00765 [candidate division Zixibacteria bacterium]|nr:hypothetical protein [candidate division Zixibacteria bacterium]